MSINIFNLTILKIFHRQKVRLALLDLSYRYRNSVNAPNAVAYIIRLLTLLKGSPILVN